jgi:hypothetical protein
VRTLKAAQLAAVRDLDHDALDAIFDALRWKLFRDFERADASGRFQIGHQLDVVALVRRDMMSAINEVTHGRPSESETE